MLSDYLEDGQIDVTGMTTLPPDGGDISDETRRLRSMSTMSNEPGPIWGANVGGDYDQRSGLTLDRSEHSINDIENCYDLWTVTA